jgi:nucleotide-binding universal stress UspA family protein
MDADGQNLRQFDLGQSTSMPRRVERTAWVEVAMTYGDILVHTDDSEAGRERVQLASHIAAFSGAHVTGYFVNVPPKPHTDIELSIEAGVRNHAYDDELKLMADCREDELRRAEAMFKAHMQQAERQAAWSVVSGDSFAALIPDAIYGDLTILGSEPLTASTPADPYFAGKLAFDTGRPVLRMPTGARAESIGTRVLVAWNGCREAARAIADARPLLERASFVAVMQVVEPWQDVQEGLDALEKVILHLRHLGVTAERYVVQAPAFEIADQISAHADRIDCNLIVMGAYGHSPIGETLLGGVTRSMLRQEKIALFLSH